MSDFRYYFLKRRVNKTLKVKAEQGDLPGDAKSVKSSKELFIRFRDDELNELKDVYNETELVLKLKDRILNEVNIKLTSNNTMIKEVDEDTKIMKDNLGILKKKLITMKIDAIIVENKKTEIDSQTLKNKLNGKNLENSLLEYRRVEEEYNANEKEYIMLSKRKFNINQKISEIQQFINKHNINNDKISHDLHKIQTKLKDNQTIFDQIEDNISFKLYFIRFSNSLVRSFFNIINIRRLQIDMIKNLSKEEFYRYKLFFKKLDELELQLIKDYNDYLLYEENIVNF
jgi:hypothetical protein